jgi:hypothetical protein
MMWLTWRQFRPHAITAAAGLAALAILLAVTGISLASDYAAAGLTTCHLSCDHDAAVFLAGLTGAYPALFYAGLVLMYGMPALIGMFWGAPLIAREFEAGTHRLAWTQSVTRRRWVAAKVGSVGLAAVAAAGLLSLMITWWASPIDSADGAGAGAEPTGSLARMSPLIFGARGIVPLGYAAAAFALGVTAGVLIRRTLPAMAVTLAVFAAVQILMPTVVRPHLMPPVTVTRAFSYASVGLIRITQGGAMTVTENPGLPGALVVSNRTITASGQVFTGPATPACTGASDLACARWLTARHLRQQVSYQPASRFWPLQWIETAVYLAVAAALGGLCLRQVRRRRG